MRIWGSGRFAHSSPRLLSGCMVVMIQTVSTSHNLSRVESSTSFLSETHVATLPVSGVESLFV